MECFKSYPWKSKKDIQQHCQEIHGFIKEHQEETKTPDGRTCILLDGAHVGPLHDNADRAAKEATETWIRETKIFYAGYRESLRDWAHWEDGVQYVGSTGTRLKDALAEIDEKEAALC